MKMENRRAEWNVDVDVVSNGDVVLPAWLHSRPDVAEKARKKSNLW